MLACARVGGLKLESRTTRCRTGRPGRRGAGTSEVWGKVHKTRNASEDDWKDVRARENVEMSVLGSIEGILVDVEFLTLIMLKLKFTWMSDYGVHGQDMRRRGASDKGSQVIKPQSPNTMSPRIVYVIIEEH